MHIQLGEKSSGSDSALLYEILEEKEEQKEFLSVNSKLFAIQSMTMGIMIFVGDVIAKYSWEMVYYIQASAMFISMLMLGKITGQGRKDLSLNKDNEQKRII